MLHLKREHRARNQLYRIFYYDCPPLTKKAHNPITKRPIDFSRSPVALWRLAFFEQLKVQRKVALRLGYLGHGGWLLTHAATKDLIEKRRTADELGENDVSYEVRQKAVDMRIGLDIASLSYKKQVDQIVLFSGDSDFVPAAKLARREGIDFILDSMWFNIGSDLNEHIDGRHSVIRRPSDSARIAVPPAPATTNPIIAGGSS